MAKAGTYNFGECKRGDTVKARPFTFLKDSLPISIQSARMQIRDTNDKIVHTPTLGIASNVITVPAIEASVTVDLLGTYNYDIEITDTSGVVSTYIEGTYTFVKDYTR